MLDKMLYSFVTFVKLLLAVLGIFLFLFSTNEYLNFIGLCVSVCCLLLLICRYNHNNKIIFFFSLILLLLLLLFVLLPAL